MRRRYIVLAVVVAIALGLVAFVVSKLFRPLTVAEAQMRVTIAGAQQDLASAQTRLDQAKRLTNSANNLVQRVGLASTPLDQAVKAIGAAEVQSREKELLAARFMAAVAPHIVAADRSVRTYDDFNAVQEAAATLSLSGFESVIIRPDAQETYQLLVPHDLVKNALMTLQEVRVTCLQVSDSPFDAHRTLSKIRANGIQATIRHLKKAGSADPEARSMGVFIRQSEAESARAILENAGAAK